MISFATTLVQLQYPTKLQTTRMRIGKSKTTDTLLQLLAYYRYGMLLILCTGILLILLAFY